MTKDVAKLRRVALAKNACAVSSSFFIDVDSKSKSSIANTPTELRVAAQIATSKLPPGLRHYVLPVRSADRLAILDWLVESEGIPAQDSELVR
ncbi:unnamed protein product [Protopolystoma xenopodis]|uniref:Uncharacterized protein n=1 Tax=Protopolystoma xenopodis TaxID=117903 RepID=A0A3S5CLW0_9PLAT|nr:unnamed protein product [Protopolystoma xenopodis]